MYHPSGDIHRHVAAQERGVSRTQALGLFSIWAVLGVTERRDGCTPPGMSRARRKSDLLDWGMGAAAGPW